MIQPKFAFEETGENKGVLRIEPLEKTLGHTIGNMLRRTLLEFVPGAAATHVKITGATHELMNLPGVVEDVLDITQRLKGLRVICHDDLEHTLTLKVDQPGIVTAAAFECPSSVEIVNPNLHLATLTEDGVLEMELTVRRGRGYVPNDEQEYRGHGWIALDSIFSPVLDAHYEVQDARVGQDLNYESVLLHVETDGTIDPQDAVRQAVGVILSLFERMRQDTPTPIENPFALSDEKVEDKWFSIDISHLNLTIRPFNALRKKGITTIGHLLQKSEPDLASIKGVGEKSLEEIKQRLAEMGLSLKST